MELSWTEAGMTIVDALGRPCVEFVEFDHAPGDNGPHDLPRLAEEFSPPCGTFLPRIFTRGKGGLLGRATLGRTVAFELILNPGMEAKELGQGNECQNLAGRITLTHRVTRPEFVTSASLFLCPHSSAIHFRF
jgi:hypothetical protein